MQERTYWLDTVEMPAMDASAPLPESVDVAVIGAGFTGLSAARALAQRGARVAVLETNSLGWGASSRNGGMVLSGTKLGVETLIARYGLDVARRIYAASRSAIDCVEGMVAEEKIDCNFSRCGYLEVACKPAHFRGYAQAAERIERDFSHKLRIIPKEALREEIGSSIYFGGLLDESSAGVNPARYVAGLGAAAMRAGACVFEHARVEGVESTSRNGTGGFTLRTPRGNVHAEKVFVGTSGYTSSATRALQKKIIPIGSYIIATEALPEALARELSPRGRMISDTRNFLFYYRLTPDRRMLFGGRAAFFPETDSTIRRSAEILRRGMIGVFPQLRDAKVDYVWGGTLDFAFDVMPHAGQLDGLNFAYGYAGHGVAMATYLGMKMAEAMCGDTVDNPFAEIPFPGAPLGLYNGRPWFLPFAAAWYKLLDWVS